MGAGIPNRFNETPAGPGCGLSRRAACWTKRNRGGAAVMGMTITEKILTRAGNGTQVRPGDVAVVDVETVVLMDMTFLPESWREVLTIHDPSKVAIIFDHLVPAPT